MAATVAQLRSITVSSASTDKLNQHDSGEEVSANRWLDIGEREGKRVSHDCGLDDDNLVTRVLAGLTTTNIKMRDRVI